MKKHAIIYGRSDSSVQRKAVSELSKILLDYTAECPVCFAADTVFERDDFRCIFVGTPQNNHYLNDIALIVGQ